MKVETERKMREDRERIAEKAYGKWMEKQDRREEERELELKEKKKMDQEEADKKIERQLNCQAGYKRWL